MSAIAGMKLEVGVVRQNGLRSGKRRNGQRKEVVVATAAARKNTRATRSRKNLRREGKREGER